MELHIGNRIKANHTLAGQIELFLGFDRRYPGVHLGGIHQLGLFTLKPQEYGFGGTVTDTGGTQGTEQQGLHPAGMAEFTAQFEQL
ncbi:hypothetical protein GCM10008940_22080 [Microbulbifer agarilyticus]